MDIKLIAFYLPQFHEIPENNEAWGQGFTEWVNVKNARPLFEGHNQPRIPLCNNYYNLLDTKVMVEQMQMAKKYGIYGFCFYHYWFNGKKVLEKPLEIMLENKDAKLPYCFAWANEAWTKTWHGAKGEKEVLIRQTYGMRANWEEHYKYLSRFFRDDRYIKKDNMPIFLIYKINNMRHRSEMFECFNEMAKKDGFNGIFLIQMLSNEDPKSMLRWISGYVDFEPAHIRNQMRQMSKKNVSETKIESSICQIEPLGICNTILDYNQINKMLLNTKHEKNHFRGIFVDYDDSPRRGSRAMIFRNSTPELFGYYLREQIIKSTKEENDMIFINAWNEWGEGNYLEPDQKYGFKYLNELKKALVADGNKV